MKNKSVRHDELEQLGQRINEFIHQKSKRFALKINHLFHLHRRQTIFILVLFGLFILTINILSFYIF